MGKFCTRCGSPIEDGQACPNCTAQAANKNSSVGKIDTSSVKAFFVSLKNRMGIGDPENDGAGLYERNMNIVPDCIKANEGEIPVKQYNLAVMRTRLALKRAEGRLQVTNKRLVFRATGRSISGRTTLQNEFAIDEIAGIQTNRDFRFSILDFLFGLIVMLVSGGIIFSILMRIAMESRTFGLILGCICGLAGLFPFFYVYKRFLLKLLPLGGAVGAFLLTTIASQSSLFFRVLLVISVLIALAGLFIFSFKPNLVITIKTKGALPAIDVQRNNRMPFFGAGNSGFAEVLPTPETESAIREVSAIISDVQKLGDFGIEKWKK